jgi:hypothetical protein
MYDVNEEIRLISNKKKAFAIAQTNGFDKSYNHFCTLLKAGLGVYFRSYENPKRTSYHKFNQKPVE